jgi:hypothetical protein
MKMDIMMTYRVFTLPVHDPGAAESELNGFLASHRVLSVDRRDPGTSYPTPLRIQYAVPGIQS